MTEEKRAYINQWLLKADDDLKAYKLLINSEFPLFAIAAFHLQQSSEKYLKAYLEYHNKTFAKTHDIEYLLQLCAQINFVFENVNAGNLSDYAVDLRYPGDIYEISKNEIEESFEIVSEIRKIVLSEVTF